MNYILEEEHGLSEETWSEIRSSLKSYLYANESRSNPGVWKLSEWLEKHQFAFVHFYEQMRGIGNPALISPDPNKLLIWSKLSKNSKADHPDLQELIAVWNVFRAEHHSKQLR